MLQRLKYVSRFARPMAREELVDLCAAAAEKNRRLDITGILLVAQGVFFQVLEGPPEAVSALYLTVAQDPRHRDIFCLGSEDRLETRLFSDWSMRLVELPESTSAAQAERLGAELEQLVSLQDSLSDRTGDFERALSTALRREAQGAPDRS